MIYKNIKMIKVSDWDYLVTKTYGRPYSFQQQDGCKSRGTFNLTIPDASDDEWMNDSVPEIVNGEKMGVKFSKWLERDPKQPLPDHDDSFGLGLWWRRTFYPDVQMVANDLYAKGLIEEGEYVINIDW